MKNQGKKDVEVGARVRLTYSGIVNVPSGSLGTVIFVKAEQQHSILRLRMDNPHPLGDTLVVIDSMVEVIV